MSEVEVASDHPFVTGASVDPERARVLELVTALAEVDTPDVALLVDTWQLFARPRQLARAAKPKAVTNYRCGRGWGKNFTLSNHGLDALEDYPHKGLIASRTLDETLTTMVREHSGLQPCARRRGYEVAFEPGLGIAGTVVHPSGGELRIGTGDVVDACRGPNLTLALVDEISSWKYSVEGLANVELALRAPCPDGPAMIVAGTPHYRSKVRLDPEDTLVVEGTMMDNASNLAPDVVRKRQRKYAGSKIGLQELEGREVSLAGAVTDQDVIHEHRRSRLPEDGFVRVAIGVDPATRGDLGRDAVGLIAAALGVDGHVYVLEDGTTPNSDPEHWGPEAVGLYERWECGAAYYETNQGGAENGFVIQTAARARGLAVPVNAIGVWTRGAKRDRHDRVLAPLYRQGRIHHVGIFGALERELTEWTGGGKSPDHLDALTIVVKALVEGELDDDAPGPLISPPLEGGQADATAFALELDDEVERPHLIDGVVEVVTAREAWRLRNGVARAL